MWLTLTNSVGSGGASLAGQTQKHAVTKQFFVIYLLLATPRTNFRLACCLEHVWITGSVFTFQPLAQAICQNSPNPFLPPPTVLNRRKQERQSYSYQAERLKIAQENSARYLDCFFKSNRSLEWNTSAVVKSSSFHLYSLLFLFKDPNYSTIMKCKSSDNVMKKKQTEIKSRE